MRKCCRGPTPRRKTEEEVQRRPARSAAAGALGGAAAAGDDSGRASASPPFRAVRFSKAKQIGSVVDGVLFSSTTLGFAFLGVNPVESKPAVRSTARPLLPCGARSGLAKRRWEAGGAAQGAGSPGPTAVASPVWLPPAVGKLGSCRAAPCTGLSAPLPYSAWTGDSTFCYPCLHEPPGFCVLPRGFSVPCHAFEK
ncbi:unnamed protein product [Rangifer tarandus platyrhynchus]|uniref:Uncharacterized protein n=1 Tax=Rangifer tarandus platyrhynchus TaxID=3082113 RepID=A0AC59YMM7_RANTA